MSQPFDPDEPEADDPFERRSAGGYRIGARLDSSRESRGNRWWLWGVAIAAVVGIAALGPRGGATPSEPPSATASAATFVAAVATALPAVQDFAWSGPEPGVFPVLAGGLRWMDPHRGTLSGTSFDAPRGWTFVAADGSVTCACYDSPWSDTAAVEQVDLIRWDGRGVLRSRRDGLLRLESPARTGNSIARDVALTSDGSRIYLASAVRQGAAWDLALSWADVDGPRAGSLPLGRLPAADGERRNLVAVVRVSPDGASLEVAIRWRPATPPAPTDTTWLERVWRLEVTAAGPRIARDGAARERPTDAPDTCSGEGFVSDAEYALLCGTTSVDSVLPVARFVLPGGQTQDLRVGPDVGADEIDWLVDTTDGVLFRWSPFSHVLARYTVSDQSEISRSLGVTPGEIAGAVPERATSTVTPHPVRWTRFGDAQGAENGPRIVGSPDGTLLYAIGARSVDPTLSGGPDSASTGVWVFDPSDLALVAHWRAASMYEQIALTPDGRALVAIGARGSDAVGRPTAWGSSIVFHDRVDGHVARIIGDSGDDGFVPILLSPGGP